ncbi:MAG: cell division protein FtsX [Candidatus Eiseniibacteriota bacterium]
MSRFVWFLAEAWRSLWHHRSMTLTALASLTGALLVFGVFLLLTANARVTLSSLGDRREVVVYLRDSAPKDEVDALVSKLTALYGQATLVTREQAWEEFARELGGTELLEAVGQNPLPASIRIKLRPEFLHFEAMERLADTLSSETFVEEVRFGGEWVRRLDAFIETLTLVDLIIGIAVALGVLFVVANTIRLTIVARREILRIMALVGAGVGFIQTPLVLEGILVAVLAGLSALALLGIAWLALDGRPIPLIFLPWTWSLAFLGFAAFLGLLGSLLALVRFTRARH